MKGLVYLLLSYVMGAVGKAWICFYPGKSVHDMALHTACHHHVVHMLFFSHPVHIVKMSAHCEMTVAGIDGVLESMPPRHHSLIVKGKGIEIVVLA